jgi:glycosyltransferase involved in cell wall biosynthesis
MPFYNAARTLHAAIASIVTQTYTDWELLLYDDGSTDNGVDITNSFSDHRIKVLRSPNRRGLPACLNECIDAAHGDLFARMDADDIAYPDRLAVQIAFLDSHPQVDLVCSSVLVFRGDGEPVGRLSGPTTHAAIARHPALGFRMPHPTWVGRTSWFRTHRYDPRATVAQDQELLLRAHRTSHYASLPSILLGYRQDALNLGKMLRYLTTWPVYVTWNYPGLRNVPLWLLVAGVQCCKAVLDSVAMYTGLEYRLLRHRVTRLCEDEVRQWRSIWTQCPSNTNRCTPAHSRKSAL